MLQSVVAPNTAVDDRLHAVIDANTHNPVREALWGSPGSALAAIHKAERADAAARPRWQALVQAPATGWSATPTSRCAAPRCCRPTCTTGCWTLLGTLQATAVQADGCINWHPVSDAAGTAGRSPLVHDCHGAQGVVGRLASAPRSAAWGALLRGAGELVWRAGPLEKGPGLCHGTAGNAWPC